MASASAFCPGHITAFFEIVEAEEPLKKGSRGVGFCISKGVVTQVNVKKASEQNIDIRVNGKEVEADTTELVARIMLKAQALDVKIRSKTELPVSQGFGMSGAGALSTAVALNKVARLNLNKIDLVRIAHVAEVEAMTGLGDVYPQSLGGLEMRLKPGVPPHGEIKRKRSEHKLVLCIFNEPLETKDVLTRPLMRKKISEIGFNCIEEYQSKPSWSSLFKLAKRFSLLTDLGTQKTLSAIAAVENEGGMAAMAMLGNAVFASGEVRKMARVLKDHGEVIHCNVENRGARLIQRA